MYRISPFICLVMILLTIIILKTVQRSLKLPRIVWSKETSYSKNSPKNKHGDLNPEYDEQIEDDADKEYNTSTQNSDIRNTTKSWNIKTILIWNPQYKHSGMSNITCDNCHCVVTENRSLLNFSSAVIISSNTIMKQYLQKRTFSGLLPNSRENDQIWIFASLEAPPSLQMWQTVDEKNEITKLFNWTMGYHRNSDIWNPYGYYNGSHIKYKETIIDIKQWSIQPDTNFAENKTKLVFSAISNCITSSRREVYIHDLQHYTSVDIYGRCGDLFCEQNTSCEDEFYKPYKFYLAFENSICEDYVTEKLWRALVKWNVVPIVLGGADYETLLPPNSYIDIADFSSTSYLARFLKMLNENDNLYNQYFMWKFIPEHRDLNTKSEWPLETTFCQICNKLNSAPMSNEYFMSLEQVYDKKRYCKKTSKYYDSTLL
ncbi:unnamed protein product [Owenia fusiformis]|uniref:Fucosyltransferase n=1 Tax=Owenia fusiformis TaxID=6347 RepID=A0A8J1XWE4_OWEFU|nr:unnamed protein product [Owenia fusiformis]